MTWESEYSSKLQMADAALSFVKSGMRVYIKPGCANPEALVEALIRRAPELHNVEIVHMMTMGAAPLFAGNGRAFSTNAVFVGANLRDAINDGRGRLYAHLLERNRGVVREWRYAH